MEIDMLNCDLVLLKAPVNMLPGSLPSAVRPGNNPPTNINVILLPSPLTPALQVGCRHFSVFKRAFIYNIDRLQV
jgi:hypothetical protein